MRSKIVIALALVTFKVSAQTAEMRASYEPERKPVRLTPVAGLTASAFTGSRLVPDAGSSYGLLSQFGAATWQLELGVTYNIYRQRYIGWIEDVRMSQKYLTVPVAVRANLMGRPNRTVYLKAGLLPSFLTEQKYDHKGWVDAKGDMDGFKKYTLLATGGIGGAFPAGKSGAVTLELSYFHGLTKAVNSEKWTGDNGRLQGGLFTLGYAIAL